MKKSKKDKANKNEENFYELETEKLGHREVKDGVVHYKKVRSIDLKKSIQFGIHHFISGLNGNNSKYNMKRNILMQDFSVTETIHFPK